MRFDLDNDHVRTAGRNLVYNDHTIFSWSGSYAEFTFTGRHASAVINCKNYDSSDSTYDTWIAVYADYPPARPKGKKPVDSPCPELSLSSCDLPNTGSELANKFSTVTGAAFTGTSTLVARFALSDGTAEYELYDSQEINEVTLRIVKMSEAQYGSFYIDSIETDDPCGAKPTEEPKKRIEFIGDSITCGFGIEGRNDIDPFCTRLENPMKAYACQTAFRLNADYRLISWSGIGITSFWIPPEVDEPLRDVLMPDLYPYIDKTAAANWSAAIKTYDGSYDPDLIVLHIGTNDASYTRMIPDRTTGFSHAYEKFLKTVHKINPRSKILCIYGIMEQTLQSSISQAVMNYSVDTGDHDTVRYLALDKMQESDNLGSCGHPGIVSQRKLADSVADAITSLGICD